MLERKTHPSQAQPSRLAARFRGRRALALCGLLLLVLCSLLGLLASCDARNNKKAGAGGPPPAPVRVAIAEIATVPIQLQGIGTVEPLANVSLRPRVTGLITEVMFQEGQDVQEGDVLFVLDRRPFEVALREAQANFDQARTQAANAAAEARRYVELAAAGVASRQEAEQRQAAATAQAAAVEAQAASVAARRLDLEYATIRAPISGRTGAVQVREGNLAQANETELVVINQIQPVTVTFTVPEQGLRQLQEHMARGDLPITASLPDDRDLVEEGAVTFVDNAVERATGTVRVKGTFPNEELLLWPGQYVETVVTLETRPNALVVPSAAIQTGQEGTFVFVIAPDQMAHMRKITVGERVEGNRAIVDEGLSAGEQVVIDGQIRLVPGAKVSVVGEPVAGSEPADEEVASPGAPGSPATPGSPASREGQ
jgi:multidrug efflux system membrane fusion protein